MVLRYIFLFILILHILPGKAQDPQYSQFYANPLYLAPSFAGATEDHRIASSIRDQWPQIPGAFLTYSFSYDHFFSNFNSGIGILFMRDQAGSGKLSNTHIGIQYAYNIQIYEDWNVRPAVHFSYIQRSIDFSRLIFNDMLASGGTTPTTVLPPSEQKGDIDFGTSVLVFNKKYWGGFGIDHLLKPNQSLYGEQSIIPLKFTVFGGMQILKRGRLTKPLDESLSVAFLYKKQELFTQFDVGLYWLKEPLMLGLWYRGMPIVDSAFDRDALIVMAGIKSRQFHIGYSYDFTISSLFVNSTGGAHEISLMYEFETPQRKKRKVHAIPCPEF